MKEHGSNYYELWAKRGKNKINSQYCDINIKTKGYENK